MDDPVILQAVLTLWAGILAGCILGRLAGWRTRFAVGMATGLPTLGVARAVHTAASALRRDEWQTPAIFLLLGTAFAIFGFGAVMLG